MNKTYLHLGANQGEILKNILTAFEAISVKVGPILKYSKFYKTSAWGKTDQADFINVAIRVDTMLKPQDLLTVTQEIESSIDRKQEEHWGAREIDIDILYYNDLIVQDAKLSIPHPLIAERNFVLIPLLELDADYCDPLHQKTVEELYLSSRDESTVILL